MKELLSSLILVLVFTLVYSCSDNRKQRKLEREIEETHSRIKDMHENILFANDTLETALNDIRREQEVFSKNRSPKYDSLWQAYQVERSGRKALADSVGALLSRLAALRSHEEPKLIEAQIKKLSAQATAYTKKYEKMLQSHVRFERMHDELLYGHLTDVH